LKKFLAACLLLIVLGVGGSVLYFTVLLPRNIPVPDVRVGADPELVERGRYLANHVAVCVDCHSSRDWSYFAGPIKPGTIGKGGETFDRSSGLPGVVVSKNITPYSLADWSDGELYRVITGGIDRDGNALFPLMPYDAYRFMDADDLLAIIAYLRSLEPIENDVPSHQLDFPLNLIVNSIPRAAELREIDHSDQFEYGEYLSTLAGCTWCHSPLNQTQQVIEELALSGGHAFPMGDYVVNAGNISSDRDTGIGAWTLEQFIARFRQYQGEGEWMPLAEGGFNSLMPWTRYADMSDEDLAAIYAFLMQSRPIRNPVQTWTRLADAD